MSRRNFNPTAKELEILQILWKTGPASVRDVHKALGGEDTNGYTTILKILQIMHEKKMVTRQKSGKLHLYKAVASQEGTHDEIIGRMIETVFQGSSAKLVMSALGARKSSKEEIQAIRKYLDKLEGGEK